VIKRIFISIVSLLLISCSAQAPNEEEVKTLVQLWYMQQSSGDGAGRWDVQGVTVLSVTKDAIRKNVFNTTSLVTGTRIRPPLANPLPKEPFTDTLHMDLEWNGTKWITANQ
jgi:outer membrane biogenesis lipoprotein LolB